MCVRLTALPVDRCRVVPVEPAAQPAHSVRHRADADKCRGPPREGHGRRGVAPGLRQEELCLVAGLPFEPPPAILALRGGRRPQVAPRAEIAPALGVEAVEGAVWLVQAQGTASRGATCTLVPIAVARVDRHAVALVRDVTEGAVPVAAPLSLRNERRSGY